MKVKTASKLLLTVSTTVMALAGVSTPLAAADGSIVPLGRNDNGQTNVPAPNSGDDPILARTPLQGITIGRVDWVVIDPQGHRLGHTEAEGKINEIPGAQLTVQGGFGQYVIPEPVGGDYELVLTGKGEDISAGVGNNGPGTSFKGLLAQGEVRRLGFTVPGARVAPAWAQPTNEYLKLLASDGTADGGFGFSIAIDDGVVAVGALKDDDNDNGREFGSAYVFDAFTGEQIAKLLSSDGAAGDEFGVSIAIDNGVVAVGARFDDDNGRDSGSAYVFDASTGAQIAKLLPSDGAPWSHFGSSIAIDNGVVAVTALKDDSGINSGSVYLFDAFTGAQIAKLLPNDGVPGYGLGQPIAIDNGVVVVGSDRDNDNGNGSGSACLFDASTGAQIARLLPDDGEEADAFGVSVSISGDTVVIGAIGDDDNAFNAGSAYVFTGSGGVWTEQAKLLPYDGAMGNRFGFSVSISGDTAVIGSGTGSAYVFARRGGVWTEQAKLLPVDGGTFGWCVSISGETAVVGGHYSYDNGRNSGSAYVFDIADCQSCCDGDVDGDGQVNLVDSVLVQAAFGSTDEQDVCHYDLDCDGQISPVDSGIVQSLFGTCQSPDGVLSRRADRPKRRSKSSKHGQQQLTGRRFRSVGKREVGLGEEGAVMGHWSLRFKTNNLVAWRRSDMSGMLHYTLNRQNQIRTRGGNIAGSYHVAADLVFWGGLWYEPVEPLPRPRP